MGRVIQADGAETERAVRNGMEDRTYDVQKSTITGIPDLPSVWVLPVFYLGIAG